jgi:hypothetical protein
MQEMLRRGRALRAVRLRAAERCRPARLDSVGGTKCTQLVVDGLEQLNWYQRWRLMRQCRRAGIGLLATCHFPLARLPVIYRTHVDEDLAWQIVERLQAGKLQLIGRADVAQRLVLERGNLREVLFHLYDLYAQRSSNHVSASVASTADLHGENNVASGVIARSL